MVTYMRNPVAITIVRQTCVLNTYLSDSWQQFACRENQHKDEGLHRSRLYNSYRMLADEETWDKPFGLSTAEQARCLRFDSMNLGEIANCAPVQMQLTAHLARGDIASS